MTHVIDIFCTGNTVTNTIPHSSGEGRLFSAYTDREAQAAHGLIGHWHDRMLHLQKNGKQSADGFVGNLRRVLLDSSALPWTLTAKDVEYFFINRRNRNGETLSPNTVAVYSSTLRSFQAFLHEPDITAEIVRNFQTRPEIFITEENAIGVKRKRADWKPKGKALCKADIDRLDETFKGLIIDAKNNGTKSYLPHARNRVMFHLAIHLALRIGDLESMLISNFSSSSNPKLKAKFDRFGCVYVCGKNSVAATLPIRDPDIYHLLMWYLENIRPPMLARALNTKKAKMNNGQTKINDKMVPLEDVLFISERGNGISGNTFRDALDGVQVLTGLPFHFTPHDLRHTGCTQMMEVYQAPHIAQQYMRHKNLATTFGYYHPDPVDAGSEINKAMNIKLPSGQNDHET